MCILFYTVHVPLCNKITYYGSLDLSTSVCTTPAITGYYRPHGIAVSTYMFTWKSARCDSGDVVQYEIQFTQSCSTLQPVAVLTGSNMTTATVAIISCSMDGCYARVRGEFFDGSFTEYSRCVLIDSQLIAYESE